MIPTLSPFAEVALLLVLAAGVGTLGMLLRQPLIVAFIAVGLIAGPAALDVVRSDVQIELLSQLGIAVLLFLVGIKLDVKLIRSLGAVAVTTGLGQVGFTAFFGYLIGLALGLGHVTSLYVAVALTFSSTIIIVKLLSDKREIDALHGQIALGFVAPDALGLVTLVGLVTIAASTYMITWSHRLYALFEPVLGVFERAGTPREPAEQAAGPGAGPEVLLFGLGRFGTAIGLRLHRRGVAVLGVDFNPQAVRRWRDLGLPASFGDATDPEFVAELPLRDAHWIVSTVPVHPTGLSHEDLRRTLVQLARGAGFRGRIAAASHGSDETLAVYAAGADLVLEPFQDAADRAVDLLCGARTAERTDIPQLAGEDRATA